MQERHQNNSLYFEEQSISTQKYVIPYIEEIKQINENSFILEVGCGQGGNLFPFLEKGCHCTGIDIDQNKISMGQDFFKNHIHSDRIKLIYDSIYDINPDNFQKFDIILLRDVIEHLPDKFQIMKQIKSFLKEDGIVFFAFPPWRMPFGGHQQVLQSKILSKLPWYHILPKPVYRWMLKLGKINNESIKGMLDVKQTGISIAQFRKLVKQNGYHFIKTTDWFINPNYEIKFNLKQRKVFFLFRIPYFRDFFTTSYYAVIARKNYKM